MREEGVKVMEMEARVAKAGRMARARLINRFEEKH
jgi:hypothetical protein